MFRAFIACAALAIAACATPTPPSASNATAQKAPCAPEATRLPQKGCGPGSTYNQTEVSQTGQPEAGAAVHMLDPRIYSH
jgi:hypothetical protein